MTLGLSSSWRSRTVTDGGRLVEELTALGFDGLELEYRIGPETFEEVLGAVVDGRVPVLSVHNFLPGPGETGRDDPLLSSPDRREREEAVRRTIVTMETALRLGAGAVVLHLGRVDHPGSLASWRREVLAGRGGNSRSLLEDFLASRAQQAPRHFEEVLRSLDTLNAEALSRGLVLGVENRFHVREIPSFDEMGSLLGTFEGGALRYWHDVGHALYQEKLGVRTQAEWLEAYGRRMAGIHLHDIRGFDDHLAPGTGEADFRAIGRHVPREAIGIVEVRGNVPLPEIVKGRELLEQLGY